jgi:hypothetical protein
MNCLAWDRLLSTVVATLTLYAVRSLCLFNPFFASLLLAIEAQQVIELRLVRLAWGGQEGWAEMNSMVFEKIAAATEATTTLMTGGTHLVARYHEHVAANTERLRA